MSRTRTTKISDLEAQSAVFYKDVVVRGNFSVISDSRNELALTQAYVEDSGFELNKSNPSDLIDSGIFTNYHDGTNPLASGLYRDASDTARSKPWKLFKDYAGDMTASALDFDSMTLDGLCVDTLYAASEVTSMSGSLFLNSAGGQIHFSNASGVMFDNNQSLYNMANLYFAVGGSREIQVQQSDPGVAGGHLLIRSGFNPDNSQPGGDLTLQAGNGSTKGKIVIGDLYTSVVELGASGLNTAVKGAFSVAETATMSSYTRFLAGSSLAPGITPIGDTDTGIYSNAADWIGFVSGASYFATLDNIGNFRLNTDVVFDDEVLIKNNGSTGIIGKQMVLQAGNSTDMMGGSLYLRAGSGATSHGAIFIGDSQTSQVNVSPKSVFQNAIEVTGGTTSDGLLLSVDGSLASPAIQFASANDAGFYRSAANTLGFKLGASALLLDDQTLYAGTAVGTGVPKLLAVDSSNKVRHAGDAPMIATFTTASATPTGDLTSDASGTSSVSNSLPVPANSLVSAIVMITARDSVANQSATWYFNVSIHRDAISEGNTTVDASIANSYEVRRGITSVAVSDPVISITDGTTSIDAAASNAPGAGTGSITSGNAWLKIAVNTTSYTYGVGANIVWKASIISMTN